MTKQYVCSDCGEFSIKNHHSYCKAKTMENKKYPLTFGQALVEAEKGKKITQMPREGREEYFLKFRAGQLFYSNGIGPVDMALDDLLDLPWRVVTEPAVYEVECSWVASSITGGVYALEIGDSLFRFRSLVGKRTKLRIEVIGDSDE